MRGLLVMFAALSLTACQCGGPGVQPGSDGGGGGGDGGERGDGGGGAGDGGVACIDGLKSISLSPANQVVTVGATPAPIAFTATGTLTGGDEVDLTGKLAWTAKRGDDTEPGTFPTPGSYQPQAGTGGLITLEATDGCVTGTTQLTLKLEVAFQDPGSAVTDRFAGTVVTDDAGLSPTVVYPSDQTRFPRNIYKVLFQWKRAGHDWFRLTFEGPYSKTVVYTEGGEGQCAASAATAGCYQSDSAAWLAIAGANAGEVTTLTIDGVIPGDANVYRAAPIQLGFSRRDVKGAIFYWSTTAAGIRRASVSDAEPEAYVVARPTATQLPNGAGQVKCVACHTVSRSGKKMIAYTEAGTKGEFVYNVTLTPPPEPVLTTELSTAKGFGTFRPDDQRVVATVGKVLAEFAADTGEKVGNLPVAEGTNPDWSPAGNLLAYSTKGGDSPGGAGLAVIPYENETWGTPQTLVPGGTQTNLFPSFSPDGAYIAYARGKGGHGDKTLQLYLIKADGSEAPIELEAANRVVNGEVTAGQHENNMPTWAPPGDYDWVAFNSVRPYGVVFPNGGTQQIWVAAIDRAKLANGEDPSFPAFRFAFQGLTEDNHRAFWTLDVRVPEDGGTSCLPLGSVCTGPDQCCLGTECVTGEFGSGVCQPPPPDAGMCIPEGDPCDQTGGDLCCTGSVCDISPDGGQTVCRGAIIN